jgi:hypothetical protein
MNKKQLEELQELGELQFSKDECATIMGFSRKAFSEEFEADEVKAAYERGRLKASAEVRRAILQQAKQGSTPAQKQMIELITRATRATLPESW